MKGVMRFGKKGKLSTRFIEPYKIAKKMRKVSYMLELPQELATVHLVFDISIWKKCVGDPSLSTPEKLIGSRITYLMRRFLFIF